MVNTKQDLFNNAYTGVLKQGGYSAEKDSDGYLECLYRDSQGRACAIGQSIPDKLYDEGLEFMSASKPEVREAANVHPRIGNPFLNHLQSVHDDCAREGRCLDTFRVRMQAFAKARRLTVTK